MTLGEKIQALRKSHSWSQEQLAERIGVTRQALSKWENGTAIPDTNNVVQLAKLFGVTTDYLLMEDYGSGAHTESVNHSNDELIAFREKQMKLFGCMVIKWTGILGILVLMILGSFVHFDYAISWLTPLDFLVQRIYGFLDYYNLGWLFWALIVIAFVGEFKSQAVENEFKQKTAEPSE